MAGTPSKIRRLADLAKKAKPAPDGQADYAELFRNVLHHQEHGLFEQIMASLEAKAPALTDLHKLDAAIAVASGLVMCRLMDSGQFSEMDKVAPSWNRHARPLIAAINDRLLKSKTKGATVLGVFQDLLEEKDDDPTRAEPPLAPLETQDNGELF